MADERTFLMAKPDAVQRGIVGEIIKRFENKGFTLCGLKMLQPTKAFAEAHYADLSSKPFFGGLTDFLSSGPVVAMCWEGKGVVKTARKMLGETNPAESLPGTIRGDFSIDIGRNILHGSDSVESAQKELGIWFKEGELVNFKPTVLKHIYEK
uniref:Nucleoside diphosphate kinase n=1 Tax=Sexangularia sp. CB-2014 TaxID=1486929 RepID=A0A7S1VKU0_9EUKA|mmetsp:Transcript_4385/g.14214  ORF Transcript_4385/g.14214 Transcript_4385/m.14214 type:complete len:153 (+) Transcript_4385:99-557(+)